MLACLMHVSIVMLLVQLHTEQRVTNHLVANSCVTTDCNCHTHARDADHDVNLYNVRDGCDDGCDNDAPYR